jgi:hypothetical protein
MVREWYVESRHLHGCSPSLCLLRTDGLAPTSKYLMYRSHDDVYGPSKPSSLLSTDVWLSLLLHWFARERNWVWTHWSVGQHAMDCVRSHFSREQWLCPTLSLTHEGLLYVDHVWYIWSYTIRELSVKSAWRVGQVFPCKVYIDSNLRDSWIWVTAYLWLPARK